MTTTILLVWNNILVTESLNHSAVSGQIIINFVYTRMIQIMSSREYKFSNYVYNVGTGI